MEFCVDIEMQISLSPTVSATFQSQLDGDCNHHRHLELSNGSASLFCDVLFKLTSLESLRMEIVAPCNCNFDYLTALTKLTHFALRVMMPSRGCPLNSIRILELPFLHLRNLASVDISLPPGMTNSFERPNAICSDIHD